MHLKAHGMLHLADDVQLVASELATNAIAHAKTPFTLALSEADGLVLLVIEDESQSPLVPGTPEAMDMSGRGLMLVEHVSDDWGTNTDGCGVKSVWASFLSHP